LSKLLVRIWREDYTLSLPQIGATVNKIEDIGKVLEAPADPMKPSLDGVSIIGVKELYFMQRQN